MNAILIFSKQKEQFFRNTLEYMMFSWQENCVKTLRIWGSSFLYLAVFEQNTGKQRTEKIPYLDTFYTVEF